MQNIEKTCHLRQTYDEDYFCCQKINVQATTFSLKFFHSWIKKLPKYTKKYCRIKSTAGRTNQGHLIESDLHQYMERVQFLSQECLHVWQAYKRNIVLLE